MSVIQAKELELQQLKQSIDFNSSTFNEDFEKIQALSKEIEVLKVQKLKNKIK